ncbi:hypothetical protein WKK05_22495 [Nostoc sp. UHCC 0302]|uniref:hypothetical protein n=1 Tax=Nostoc sp. UHCC 0302 TaxID=3134896 RepID=UPI00311CB525
MKSEMSQENSVNYCIKQIMGLDRRPSWPLVINFLKEKGFVKAKTPIQKIKNKAYLLIGDGVHNRTPEEIQKILEENGIKGIKIQNIN